MNKNGLQLNLDKCHFGNNKVVYLAFTLTPQGILPVKEQNQSLKRLSKTDQLETGPQLRWIVQLLLESHQELCHHLYTTNEPHPPRIGVQERTPTPSRAESIPLAKNKTGSGFLSGFSTNKFDSGIAALLCQIDQNNQFHISSYYSRQLQDNETKYTPFLLDLLAAKDGMKNFDQQL